MGDPATVAVPIDVRIDPVALADRVDDLDDAVSASTAQVLRRARQVPALEGGGHAIAEVKVDWGGELLAQVSEQDRARADRRIRASVVEAAAKEGVTVRTRRDPFGRPSAEELAEQAPAPASGDLDVLGLLARLQGDDVTDRGIAMLEIRKLVVAGDELAVWLALMAIQPDDASPTAVAISALRELWQRDPARFRAAIQANLAASRPSVIERDDCDLKVPDDLREGLAPTLGAVDRLAREIPEAKIGAGPALAAAEPVLELLGVWREAWVELVRHLSASKERTEPAHLAAIRARPQNVQSLAGIVRTFAADERLRKLLPDLEADVREATRLTFATAAAVAELDVLLGLYRESFGAAAPHQEEVKVLMETRAAAIRALAECPLPRAQRARTMQDELAEGLVTWHTTAGVRRTARVRAAIGELTRAAGDLRWVDPYYEWVFGNSPWGDVRVPYWARVTRLNQELADLGAEFELVAEEPYEIGKVLAIEGRLAVAAVRIPILGLYMATLELEKYMHEPYDIGSASDQRKLYARIEPLRVALAAAYDKPDFGAIPTLEGKDEGTQIARSLEWWRSDVESMASELRAMQRGDIVKSIGLNIAALLLTKKFVGVGGASVSVTRVTFAEAAVFTAITTFGRAVVLDKQVDPSSMLTETVDNFLLFGAFRVLHTMLEAGALALLRGRPGAQLALVLGSTTVISTGLPVLVMRLEAASRAGDGSARGWGEPEATAVATGLLLNAVMAAISGRAMLTRLRVLNATALSMELAALRPEALRWATELAQFMRSPGPAAQFNVLQRRGVALSKRTETVLRRLAELPDELHAQMGTTRGELLNQADWMAEWVRRLGSMVYRPGAVPLLPAPAEAAGGALLVPRPGGVYEYDPARPGSNPKQLEARLRQAGYTVRAEGGILRLSAGTGPILYRLLPAPSPAPKPAVSAEMTEAEALVLAAAGPGRQAVIELLARPRGDAAWTYREALLTAAQLEPELVRRALVATGPEVNVQVARLGVALRDLGIQQPLVELALEAAAAAASARGAAETAGPRQNLLIAAGGSLRAREVLATADGRALLEAAALAPEATLSAVLSPANVIADFRAAAIKAWGEKKLSAEKITAASTALDSLVAARLGTPLAPAEEIAAAVGYSLDRIRPLQQLKTGDPAGYAALLEAVERERALVVRAIRALEQRTLVDATSELVRRLQAAGKPQAEIMSVGNALAELNAVRRREALRTERLLVEAERGRTLTDEEGFRRDAPVVIQRFSSPRRERAQEWLDAPNGMRAHLNMFAEEVVRSPRLMDLAGQGGVTMLRQLWTMYRAGRTRWPRVLFPEYVEILQRIHRGLHGEYQFAFWAGRNYIVIKAPDAGVTVPGTDIILIPRGGGPPILVDNKALADWIVRSVSALTRNLPKNLQDDQAMLEELIASGREYPQELLVALPLLTEASRRIQAITKGLSKDTVETDPLVRQRIAQALEELKIPRVVSKEAGQVRDLADDLKGLDKFELWDASE